MTDGIAYFLHENIELLQQKYEIYEYYCKGISIQKV